MRSLIEGLASLSNSEGVARLIEYCAAEADSSPPGALDLNLDRFLIKESDVFELLAALRTVGKKFADMASEHSAYLAGAIANFIESGYEEIDQVHRPSSVQ